MSTYRVASGVLRAELEGKEVLLNTESGVYHLVNETGRIVLEDWELGLAVDEVVQDVARRSGVPEDRVSEDTKKFVAALLERGLIEEVS